MIRLQPKSIYAGTPTTIGPHVQVLLRVFIPLSLGAGSYVVSTAEPLINAAKHTLADGLWAYAFVSALLLLWNERINMAMILAATSAFFGFEYAQGCGILPGTGDKLDVLVYFVSGILAITTGRWMIRSGPEFLDQGRLYWLSSAVCAVFLLMAAASGVPKAAVSMERGHIPKDFAGFKGILLIELQQSKDWNKYARKHFSENYHGEMKFVETSEVETTYADREEYPFIVTREQFANYGNGGVGTTYSSNLCMVDRKNRLVYSTGSTSFYGKLLKTYAKELDAVRKR